VSSKTFIKFLMLLLLLLYTLILELQAVPSSLNAGNVRYEVQK